MDGRCSSVSEWSVVRTPQKRLRRKKYIELLRAVPTTRQHDDTTENSDTSRQQTQTTTTAIQEEKTTKQKNKNKTTTSMKMVAVSTIYGDGFFIYLLHISPLVSRNSSSSQDILRCRRIRLSSLLSSSSFICHGWH